MRLACASPITTLSLSSDERPMIREKPRACCSGTVKSGMTSSLTNESLTQGDPAWFFATAGRAPPCPSCLLISLASQLIEGEPLAHDPVNGCAEALRVRHLAIIESIRLLVQIAEQVERLH